jgi:hypothetical protein
LPHLTATAVQSSSTRFQIFIWDGTTDHFHLFQTQPATVTVNNDSASPLTVWIDRYTTNGSYYTNAAHVTIAAGGNYVVGWDIADATFAGIGINGDFLPVGTWHMSIDFVAAADHCQYGTELQAGAQFVYYLTPGLIDAWLTTEGLVWMAPLFTAFWFTTINAQTICGTGPPPMPVIDLTTLTASQETLRQILYVIAWPNLCRCIPGAPAPTPFPAPTPSEPPGWPTPPVLTCSNADICTALQTINQQISAIQQSLSIELGVTTLFQRYRLPFATIPGAAHAPISGSGSFAISRLIGMRVEITTPPAGGTTLAGNPPYVLDQGWMAIETADGILVEKRISQTRMSWLPEAMPDATIFAYYLNAGVVATFQELEAEP